MQHAGEEDSPVLEQLALASHRRSVRLHIAVQAALQAAGVDISIMDYVPHDAGEVRSGRARWWGRELSTESAQQ